ncbi:hypothetical protein [uncultured Alteromonas sp.]|uniref:hypothetical protein n=1 Tax=uncultured Alteromonas sp. TaxID=179113 RepID=UPI0030EB9E40|tara:strand:- start:47 stop:235 length:189 start_codon:yes stop_codon:yes gene_type:complete
MNNRQRKKAEAILHNENLEKKKSLALDKINNPEKYARKKPTKAERQKMAIITGMCGAFGVRL